MMILWNEADFTDLNPTYNKDQRYSNLAAALDIETSQSICDGKKIAYMYIWQLAIEDIVVYGRTWDDLRSCLNKIQDELKLNSKYRLIIYVHNLKYEFAFFKRELDLKTSGFLARDKNDVIKCDVSCYQIRDSYTLAEKSLAEIGKEVNIEKLEMDYKKIRHTKTPLTPTELNYCERDVQILVAYIRRLREKYGSVYNIPLTLTQIIKRRIMDNCTDKKDYTSTLRTKLKDCQKDNTILVKLQSAFSGGINYFKFDLTDIKINNVTSVDITSSYPAQILLHKYPMSKFKEIDKPKDYRDIMTKGYYNTKPLLIVFSVNSLKTKYSKLSFLSADKNKYDYINASKSKFLGNKLLNSEAFVQLCLNDVDFKLFLDFYEFTDLNVKKIYASNYSSLPKYIIDTVVDLYCDKQQLKNKYNKIKEKRLLTAEEEANYYLTKSLVNRIYGAFVQNPIAENYEYDNDSGDVVEIGEERINKRYPVLYQWGVWVTSWARYELLSVYKKIAIKRLLDGKRKYVGNNILYMDTDSIKYIDNISYDNIIAQYNADVNNRVKIFCQSNNIDYDLLKGIGTFEIEHYKTFKCVGLKRYCYVDNKDRFVFHISGLPTNNRYFDALKTNREKLDAVTSDMAMDAETARKQQVHYYTTDVDATVTDYLGNVDTVHVKSYCTIEDIGFKINQTDDLIDWLRGMDKKALQKNFGGD